MARTTNKLTAKTAENLKDPGLHGDGGGLFLEVAKVRTKDGTGAGSKGWLFVYRSPVVRVEQGGKRIGKQRRMGLGAFGTERDKDKVSLAAARKLAEAARALVADGKDPLDERNREVAPVKALPTFGELADQFIAAMSPSWKNDKHADQWRMTLQVYAAPLRAKPVDQIAVADVLACLKPHWEQRPETADRLRGRIERVLNAAKAQGYRTGENPAAWRGHLENLLPKRSKLTRGHHAAMPWADVPGFLADLRARQGIAALCLEFLVLTAARSGEARGALWDEIDEAAKVWTIPGFDPETGRRMKAGQTHRVPLTPRMLAILDIVKPLRRDDGLVFPGMKDGAPLSDMTLAAVMKRMKLDQFTPHGFRSAFRDWAGSATAYPRELAEEALAHVIGNAVERSYRRGDALERRRELMAAWEKFCAGSNVVELASHRKTG